MATLGNFWCRPRAVAQTREIGWLCFGQSHPDHLRARPTSRALVIRVVPYALHKTEIAIIKSPEGVRAYVGTFTTHFKEALQHASLPEVRTKAMPNRRSPPVADPPQQHEATPANVTASITASPHESAHLADAKPPAAPCIGSKPACGAHYMHITSAISALTAETQPA